MDNKKILVAVDGSDKSLEAADYALSIASRERTELIILSLVSAHTHSETRMKPWFL